MSRCEVVRTRRGGLAMLDAESGEVMHPITGPLVEPEHVYVRPARLGERLLAPEPRPLRLLDAGLGAGSNVAAALRVIAGLPAARRRLEIVSLDRSVAALELALTAEHQRAFGWDGAALAAARDLLGQGAHEAPGLAWQLLRGDLLDSLGSLGTRPDAAFDIVFWDPFSPRATPALWTLAAFRAVRRVCRPGASLHTYSGATAVRSALLLAGFCVGLGDEIAPGRRATHAALDPCSLDQPLDARWLERLARSSAAFPADAPDDALARARAAPQFSRCGAGAPARTRLGCQSQ